MESFFSLFDPSEGGGKPTKKKHRPDQDNVKKKGDAPKGRRRGRKAHGKNETLPEESSFLCEPDLSTDVLVKDGSYIENYIELNKKDEDHRQDDRKPKRRNSNRKCRRRKSKMSPAKETCESDVTSWNNQSAVNKATDDTVGKNVNDLTYEKTSNKRFDETVSRVIERLEKVGLKDDGYLAGDFNTDDLDDDGSDEMGGSYDDTESDGDDSAEEVYGSLPPEPRFGNVEYKLQLVSPCEKRFQHLVTQLKWRLRSGGGRAVYVVGVRDCGALRGLGARPLRASLLTLRRMAAALHASLAHVTARRVAPNRAVAEVYIRKLPDAHQSVELRVAVMGANEAGKSTLIGVLTQGELDNGRGSSRLNMFRHLHEVKSGRTSSLSHEILGFDAQGNVVNYGCSELMTAERIGERSAKLVSFLDLAGHSKYQRTTRHGLTGYCPHRAMLAISATAGITSMTEEHIALAGALDVPMFAVVTKCDIAGSALGPLLKELAARLELVGQKPLLITDENLARNCVAPQKLILDTIDNSHEDDNEAPEDEMYRRVPVFPVSCVRGTGLRALHAYLLALTAPQPNPTDTESCEFQIDEIFHVGDLAGPVVGGLMTRGQLYEGDTLIIGPFENGEFREILVRTIYRNRARCGLVRAGHCASLGLAVPQSAIKTCRTSPNSDKSQSMENSSFNDDYNVNLKSVSCLYDEKSTLKANDSVSNEKTTLKNHNGNPNDSISCFSNTKSTFSANDSISSFCNEEPDLNANVSNVNSSFSDEKTTLKSHNSNVNSSNSISSFSNEKSTLNSNISNVNFSFLSPTKSSINFINDTNSNISNDCSTKLNKSPSTQQTKASPSSIRLRPGMVLLSRPQAVGDERPKFGACPKGNCKMRSQAADIILKHQTDVYKSKSKNKKTVRRKNKNILQDIANAECSLVKSIDNEQNVYKSDSESIDKMEDEGIEKMDDRSDSDAEKDKMADQECICRDIVLLEDPNDPRGCMFFQASVHILRHSTAICPGFQCTVHVGNVRQTAIIEGIFSRNSELRAGASASVVFRFTRCPEYLVAGRRLLLTAGQGTRGIGRVTQVFPYVP